MRFREYACVKEEINLFSLTVASCNKYKDAHFYIAQVLMRTYINVEHSMYN